MYRRYQAGGRATLSEINVTPLVDVMLVLLVIFMITVPVIESGIQVNVPQTRSTQALSQALPVVTVDRAGNVYFNDKLVPFAALGEAVKADLRQSSQRDIYVRADEMLPYGTLARVMDELNRMGVGTVNLVTQPYDKPVTAPPGSAH